ncbi:fusaric acid resistance family protein [Promicromonospora sp. AC04]|uniref:FUSC family protein n=1 Tax=Promicromonospora sp. AC04 TaxID=2135723 RepID=UPI000D3B31F0|nr:FUSC family protein [Promicromonospora sp. AC04]PUB26259.1 fusaric acid resistance family protein [Promicromonospora sp. AC04]
MNARPLLPHLRRMLHVGPYGGELPVALRAAASVAVPMLVLWATGHLEWSLYATFGAFTSLFGRTVPIRARLLMQVQAGGVLVASVLLGTLIAVLSPTASAAGWVVVPVAAVWATAVAILSHRLRWHPPGPLFPVFALGACSSVPVGPDRLPVALAVTVVAALFALALTAAIARFESGAAAAPTPARPPAPASASAPAQAPAPAHAPAGRSGPAPEWTLSHYLVRYAMGVAVAGAIATAVGHPYWAMVAAVVPMSAPDAAGRLTRAAQRLAGTLVGVVIAWVLLTAAPPPLVVITIAALLQAGAELYVGRNYGVAMLFITPLALSMAQLANPVPVGELVADRALDTLVGVAVAVVITLLTHERRQDPEG